MQDDILTSFSENCKRFFHFCSDFLHIFFSLRETIPKTQDFVERKGWRTQIMRALRTDLALEAAEIFRKLYELGHKDPEYMHAAPHHAQIGRPDEVQAARNPILRWTRA